MLDPESARFYRLCLQFRPSQDILVLRLPNDPISSVHRAATPTDVGRVAGAIRFRNGSFNASLGVISTTLSGGVAEDLDYTGSE